MPKNINRLATLASANVRLRKKRIGSIGCSVRSSHKTKHTSSPIPTANEPMMPADVQPTPNPDSNGANDPRRRPTDLVGADHPPHDRDQAGAAEGQPGQIEPGHGSAALVEPQEDERREHEPDRDVQPEDPMPGEAADD